MRRVALVLIYLTVPFAAAQVTAPAPGGPAVDGTGNVAFGLHWPNGRIP